MQKPTQEQQSATDQEHEPSGKAPELENDQPTSEEAANAPEETEEAPAGEELDPWEQLELEVAKWKDQAIRTAAELDNYRKRMSREKLDAVRYGNQRLLEELLPVLDNFDMGMQAAAQEQGSMLYMGMDMVRKQLGEFLGSQNVAEIPAGENSGFDPNQHEAISQEPSAQIAEGRIIRVIRKGYCIGERLLRPSNVVVSTGPAAGKPEPESE